MLRPLIYYIKQIKKYLGNILKAKEWIQYSGKLTIYERKKNPIVLSLKAKYDSFLSEIMEDEKEFKGNSVSDVYGKLAKWHNQNDIIFQN